MRLIVLILISTGCLLLAGNLHAQVSTVTVYTSIDTTVLPRATVRFTCLSGRCADSTIARPTGADGRATNPFSVRSLVTISYAGYETLHDTIAIGEHRHYYLQLATAAEVVVTGQYAPRSAELSIYNVQVFDRQRIQSQGASTLRDLMSVEPGVRLGEDAVLGTNVSIQGLSGQNVKIMIDGVPVVGRLNGNIDLSQIPLSGVERVEMIQGPLSVYYGTDALGGVINIITDHRLRNGIKATASGYYESVGTVNWNADVRYKTGDLGIRASIGRNFFGGYSVEDTSRFKEWKPREQITTDWEVSNRFDLLRLSYTGRYFQEYILNRGEPRMPYRETAFDDTYRTYRLTNSLSLNGSPSGDGYLDAMLSYSSYRRLKNSFFKNLVSLDEQLTGDPADQDTTVLGSWILRGAYSSNDSTGTFAWQAGIDMNVESTEGRRISGDSRSINDYAVFGSVQYRPIQHLMLQPAIRYAYNSQYPAPIVPSFNLRFLPFDAVSIRLSYARGFRAPSLRDLYFLFVDINHNIKGNEQLRSESSYALQGSIDWQLHSSLADIMIEPSFYYNNITNLITLAQVDNNLYSYVNIGRYRTLGGNLQTRFRGARLDLRLGTSWIGRYNELSENYSVAAYTFSPELNGSISWQIPVIDTRVSGYYKYTGRLPSYHINSDGSVKEGYVDDYQMLDVSLVHEVLDGTIQITAGVKNLLNVKRIDVGAGSSEQIHGSAERTIPVSWGTTAFVGATFTLGSGQ